MKIIDGILISKNITESLSGFFQSLPVKPTVVIIQIGNDIASSLFVALKKKKAEKLGIVVIHKVFPEDTPQEEILKYINSCNLDINVSGVMVQSPTRYHNFKELCAHIDLSKDIDGLNYQLGSITRSAVVEAILISLENSLTDLIVLKSKHVLIINDSIILGRPLSQILLDLNATVTIANRYTSDLSALCKQADIIVSATGVASLVKKDWVNNNQILIDCGSPEPEFEKGCAEIVHAITPVPGGIGPLTVTSLYFNLRKLIEHK